MFLDRGVSPVRDCDVALCKTVLRYAGFRSSVASRLFENCTKQHKTILLRILFRQLYQHLIQETLITNHLETFESRLFFGWSLTPTFI